MVPRIFFLSSPACCCHFQVLWKTNSLHKAANSLWEVMSHLLLVFQDIGALVSGMLGGKCRGKLIRRHPLRFSGR